MPHSGAKTKPSVVFFGTGPVAARSLELLLENFAIEAIVTKPRPAHHRGSVPVLTVAENHSLPTVLVSSKHEASDAVQKANFKSNVGVLIDFGIIVSRDVIDAFPRGIINSHFSLLPEWRGADPITFSLLSGQKKTGVSLMHLVEAMDEGPLLGIGIQEDIDTLTNEELTAKLIGLSDALLRDLLPDYIVSAKKIEQSQFDIHRHVPDYPAEASYSRKLTKQDSVLDFSKSAHDLEREIRAFHGWPKSRTTIDSIDVIVTKAHVVNENELPDTKLANGDVFVHGKQLLIQTAAGALGIDALKPAGKQEMAAQAFLAGYGSSIQKI